jgi:tRNA-2-methylthio-N6-dimethylallyladenosine synthase
LEHNQAQIGTVQKILIEGVSKKSENDLKGRNTRNMMAIFPKKQYTKGQYVDVLITGCSGGTLFGEIVEN